MERGFKFQEMNVVVSPAFRHIPWWIWEWQTVFLVQVVGTEGKYAPFSHRIIVVHFDLSDGFLRCQLIDLPLFCSPLRSLLRLGQLVKSM